MQRFISKLSKPLQGTHFRHPCCPSCPSLVDEDAGVARDAGAQQSTSPDAAEETISKKLSTRERLDYLSHLRTSFDAIDFTSSTSYQGGGKAKVVQATVRRGVLRKKKIVSVKKLNYHRGMNIQKFSNEFVHEVEILAELSHENVVRLVGFVEQLEQGEAWIVLSWHPNGNVREFLATEEWEVPERISLIKDTFEGLAYLHSRNPPICHGDLKSLNILVSSSYRAIITDFGSARVLDEMAEKVVPELDRGLATKCDSTEEKAKIQVGATGNQLTLTGPAWSLRWAPPEVVNGATASLPSDIWSAGWVCWEIMTNQVPFPELYSAGGIVLEVIQGEVPSAREDAQLSQITRLCGLMTDCWGLDSSERPSVAQCQNEVACMPSVLPSGDKAPSVELLLQMGELHNSHGRYEPANSLFRQALAAAQSAGASEAIAKTLFALGTTYYHQTKYLEAEEFFIQAQDIFTRIGHDKGRANVLQRLGNLYQLQSKYSKAEKFYVHAQQIFTRIGNDHGLANVLQGLGHLYRMQTEYSEAENSFVQARQIFTRIGNDLGQANVLHGLGKLYFIQAKDSEAEESFVQAGEIYTRIGNDFGRANVLSGLGNLYYIQDKDSEAEESFVQARKICTRLGDDHGRANALHGLGDLYCSQAKYSKAKVFFLKAQKIYTRLGDDQGRANTLRGLRHVHRARGRNVKLATFFAQARDLFRLD